MRFSLSIRATSIAIVVAGAVIGTTVALTGQHQSSTTSGRSSTVAEQTAALVSLDQAANRVSRQLQITPTLTASQLQTGSAKITATISGATQLFSAQTASGEHCTLLVVANYPPARGCGARAAAAPPYASASAW